MNPFDKNIRAVYAMRTVGSDHTGLEKLCGMRNLPKPTTVKNYNNISNAIRDATKAVAETSMNAAARELGQCETITDTCFCGWIVATQRILFIEWCSCSAFHQQWESY